MFMFAVHLCELYNNYDHLTLTSAIFPSVKALTVDWQSVTPNPLDYLYTILLSMDFSR